ncbi:MAG: site-2 protease family protein [Streptosporangiaceae bacterium]
MAGITPSDGSRGTGQPGEQEPPKGRRDPRLGIVVARPFGVPVYVSPYWFLVAALLVVVYAETLDNAVHPADLRYVVAASFVVLLYLSVLVHELSHCAVARGFGLPVRRVLLYPLGGFSEIEQEPPTPSQEFLVSAAGPAVSLALAAIAFALTSVAGHGIPGTLVDQLFRANLLVGIFNLLPGLPLDGGRILRAGVWKITGKPGSATIIAAWGGRVLAILLVLLPIGLLGGHVQSLISYYWLWLAIVAAFIWIQSGHAIRAAKVRERLPRLQARTLARRAIPVPADLPLSEAIRRADSASARALVIVDHESTPVAIVSEQAVMQTPEQRRPWIQTGTVARSIDPGLVLSADLSGIELLEAVQRHRASEYLLIEPSGEIYGVLAASDLDHAFAHA